MLLGILLFVGFALGLCILLHKPPEPITVPWRLPSADEMGIRMVDYGTIKIKENGMLEVLQEVPKRNAVELRDLDVDELTPLEALNKLEEWKKKV